MRFKYVPLFAYKVFGIFRVRGIKVYGLVEGGLGLLMARCFPRGLGASKQ